MRVPAELTAILVILAVAFGSAVAVSAFSARPHFESALPTLAPPTPVLSPTPIPSVVPGPLDGEPTPRARALRRPIAVVVDNYYPDARPAFGLSDASVVYETLTEGGITRLLAIYLEHDARAVGPVRSARPYFVRWADTFRALLVHAGGSPAALSALRTDPLVADVDSSRAGQQFYSLPSHAPPHDLFTGTRAIWGPAARQKRASAQTFTWLKHKRPAGLSGRGRGRSVTIDFSTAAVASPPQYAATYSYDRPHNVYRRLVGGIPTTDASTKRSIAPSNVIILTATMKPIPNDPEQRISIAAVGSGSAVVLHDGYVTRGTWSKRSAGSPLVVSNARHKAVRLNPGSTWVEVVPQGAVRFGK